MEKRKTNSAGTIYYDKKRKKYRGHIIVGYKKDGTLIRRSATGSTKSEVRTKLEKIKNDPGNALDPSDLTIYNLAKEIIDDQFARNEIKEGTYRRSLENLKVCRDIYDEKIQKITEAQLKEFIYSHSYYSQSIINKYYQLLKRVFNEAVNREIIDRNPLNRIKKPNSSQAKVKVRAMTCEEQKKFIKVLNENLDIRFRNQMLISMFTGMRMGEVNALSVEDVDFLNNTVSIHRTVSTGFETVVSETTKTEAGTREILIPDEVAAILKRSIGVKKTGLIFTLSGGKPIGTTNVNSTFSYILKKYKVIDPMVRGKVTLHSLRHTYATRCLEAGMDAKVLQGILGHTDVSITLNTYVDVFKKYNTEHVNKANNYMRSFGFF